MCSRLWYPPGPSCGVWFFIIPLRHVLGARRVKKWLHSCYIYISFVRAPVVLQNLLPLYSSRFRWSNLVRIPTSGDLGAYHSPDYRVSDRFFLCFRNLKATHMNCTADRPTVWSSSCCCVGRNSHSFVMSRPAASSPEPHGAASGHLYLASGKYLPKHKDTKIMLLHNQFAKYENSY